MELMGVKSNKLVAEFIGTFILAFAVLASVIGLFGIVPTPIVAGLAVFVSVLSVGVVSGSHINPAVTLALYSLKKIDRTTAALYIAAQLLAGLAAMLVMAGFVNGSVEVMLNDGGVWNTRIFLAEVLGAAILLFGIMAAIKNKLEDGSQAALIAGALTIGAFMAAAAGSMGVLNPAVAICLSAFNLSYIIGPILGAVIGVNVYTRLIADKERHLFR